MIDIQQKRKVNGFINSGNNKYIRNHPNGWVFCRDNVTCPPEIKAISIEAVSALDLDFGAVDIGFHETYGPCIYEVNTAPGLEGTTIHKYANTIRELLNQ